MELQKQLISLQLAKKLKELRIEQTAYFSYYNSLLHEGYDIGITESVEDSLEPFYYSAFSVPELRTILDDLETGFRFETEYCCGIVYCRAIYVQENYMECYRRTEGDTEADAIAKILIELKENTERWINDADVYWNKNFSNYKERMK